MNKAVIFAAFALGATIGSAGTWYYTKKKYEQIAQEEIDSVKQVFTYKKEVEPEKDIPKDPQEVADEAKEKPSVAEYAKKLSREGYTNYSNVADRLEEKVVEKQEPVKEVSSFKDIPYVIPPEQFGEFDDYTKISLSFFSDHILADEDDEMVEDVEDVVGFESLNHFGEYEDDSVYVRNDRLKADYEILLDQRKYSDVIKTRPHPREV